MPVDNRDVVTAYVNALNRGDVAGMCRLFAPDAQIWGVRGLVSVEKARELWQLLVYALGVQLTVEAMIGEGDIVAVRYTERGTSSRPFLGNEPTGQSYEIVAVEWFEIRDGLIHRRWGARDSASQMRQMGLPIKL